MIISRLKIITTNIYKNVISEKYNNYSSSKNVEKQFMEVKKEEWLQKYASRILRIWTQWQTPLGVTSDYIDHIKTELANFYEDPLKKMFIESGYDCAVKPEPNLVADSPQQNTNLYYIFFERRNK